MMMGVVGVVELACVLHVVHLQTGQKPSSSPDANDQRLSLAAHCSAQQTASSI